MFVAGFKLKTFSGLKNLFIRPTENDEQNLPISSEKFANRPLTNL